MRLLGGSISGCGDRHGDAVAPCLMMLDVEDRTAFSEEQGLTGTEEVGA